MIAELVTEQDKFPPLNISSIFIMPNRGEKGNDFERFGISFLEASYFKNVVIGGRSGGASKAIKGGYGGFLVDADLENPVESIRKLIDTLIGDPAMMSRMAEFGNKHVIDNFQTSHIGGDFSKYVREHLLVKFIYRLLDEDSSEN